MRVTAYGAAGEVTGSCYLVESSSARVLLDFGLFQGSREAEGRNRAAPGFDASRLDAAVLTHAHIDHVGRMPLLPKLGFKGRIWATPASCELAAITLRDSAQLQEMDAFYQSRLSARRGRAPVEPLYERAAAERVIPMFAPVAYGEQREVAPGVSVRLVDAGHILGSASVEMTVREGGREKVVVFSGDIGLRGVPIMNDPTTLDRADLVVMESTYGDRDHRSIVQTIEELGGILHEAIWAKERVLMPAFAVGRTQLLMYYLLELSKSGRLPKFPVYVDSPMAREATLLYMKHRAILDEDAKGALLRGENDHPGAQFKFVESAEESRGLNDARGAGFIIAASGMCTGGRIVHHLKHNLWRRDVRVVIVGYQGQGTLGRRLVDGAKVVRIMGEWIAVRASVHTLGGLSAHAGQSELVDWARSLAGARPRWWLSHGEDRAREPLRDRLKKELGVEAGLPGFGEAIEI